MEQNKIIRLPDCKRITGISRSSIYDRIKKGEFPRSISLGPRAVGWVESEVYEWIQSKILESRKEAK